MKLKLEELRSISKKKTLILSKRRKSKEKISI